MSNIFQVTFTWGWDVEYNLPRFGSIDVPTAERAIALLEGLGLDGTVVGFRVERNLPHCLPEYVHRSFGLWAYRPHEANPWRHHYIYDGRGGVYEYTQPSE